ncbi:glycosyltransferase [Sphaerochaeta pleomorpha str. Grapes]|uniref:Glycosyltransferase n=1 Tax=Sphaerochaeta pleomorpha (strain ATCC BAA-1885 / DSM 22778 / Grapes) TaxID=158190 RepID=G8QS40_SPHPG|nr:glycosyltransferase [Sphaerochaeta pleomorpha]AEV28901.1 glycosyltransferase [Sphaerochaeta pleomorpha str. Grapes]
MKILITTEFYFPIVTGVATVIRNQCDVLRSLGHEVRILVIGPERKTYFEDNIYHIKASRVRFYPDSYNTFFFHDPIVKKVIAWKPDIVHSNGEFFSMVFARRIVKELSCPLIHTCHTDFPTYGKNYIKNQKVWDWFIGRVVRSRLKTVDCIISPSSKNREMLRGYGIQKPFELLPSGIDISKFTQDFPENERQRMRKDFSFTPENFVFVSICRLAAEKNIKETIDHFAALSPVQPLARLLIVGGGAERENLESQVKALGLESVIKFSGPIEPSQVWKYYRLADSFVSSSVSETQPMIAIEAISSGLPLLFRKDPSLEFSLEEGLNGFSFCNEEEFVRYATALVSDKELWNRFHAYTLATAKKFCREVWGEHLLALYETYLDKQKKKRM